MSAQHPRDAAPSPTKIVTTRTGRILRVAVDDLPEASASTVMAATAPPPTVVMDPARRMDVLFRVRREEGHEPSPWWMIGAFLVTSGAVIALLSWVPYAA